MLALKLPKYVTIFEGVRLGEQKFLEIFTKLMLFYVSNRIIKGFAQIKTKYKAFFISRFSSLTTLKRCNGQKDEYL
jgi:hypothetical protein